MTRAELSLVLRRLPGNGRFALSNTVAARAFADASTADGRAELYAFGDVHGCRLEWDRAADAILFVKRSPVST